MKRPGTSDSKAIDDPVSRLAFPVLTFCNNGCLNLKFRARRKDLERTTTFKVKVGLFPTSERDAARDQGGDFRRGLDRHSRAVRMVGHFAARMVIPTRSPNPTQRARRQNLTRRTRETAPPSTFRTRIEAGAVRSRRRRHRPVEVPESALDELLSRIHATPESCVHVVPPRALDIPKTDVTHTKPASPIQHSTNPSF